MKYRVIDRPAIFAKGQKLRLTKEQIEARAHLLDVGKSGNVMATAQIMFKPGEEITLSDSYDKLPGSLKAVLIPASEARKAEKKAEEEAEGNTDPGDDPNPDPAGDEDGDDGED